MPEATAFLSLPTEDRRDILQTVGAGLGRSVQVLEKDIWVCWTLGQLFTMPNRKPMAFKGGTSLSKAYGVIQRFSEDVDVTIDLREAGDPDPFAASTSKTKRKAYSEDLKARTQQHTTAVLQPYFQNALADATDGNGSVEAVEHGLRLHYPSVATQAHPYIPQSVFLEVGGRNSTAPTRLITIRTDLAVRVSAELLLPEAHVDVLTAERTFWEKATLIHVECLRGQLRETANRVSRHWYDLAQLVRHGLAEQAIADRELLESVVAYKRAHFKEAADGNYDACFNGGFQLVPTGRLRDELAQDHRKMLEAQMFFEAPPPFEAILADLERLQATLNA